MPLMRIARTPACASSSSTARVSLARSNSAAVCSRAVSDSASRSEAGHPSVEVDWQTRWKHNAERASVLQSANRDGSSMPSSGHRNGEPPKNAATCGKASSEDGIVRKPRHLTHHHLSVALHPRVRVEQRMHALPYADA